MCSKFLSTDSVWNTQIASTQMNIDDEVCSSAVTSCQNHYTHQSPVGCTGFPLPLNQLADYR